jgi:hypothetical protein
MTPNEVAEEVTRKAGMYEHNAEKLAGILERKPAIWNEMRKEQKSDTATDRLWDATDDGINEMKLRLAMKSQEKKMSALKTQLRVMEGEARYQW